MSRVYLQEKITPVNGNYIVVGADGNLIAGSLSTGYSPSVNINTPTISINNFRLSVTVGNYTGTSSSFSPSDYIKSTTGSTESSTSWIFVPPFFGTWNIDITTNDVSISITELKTYSVDLT